VHSARWNRGGRGGDTKLRKREGGGRPRKDGKLGTVEVKRIEGREGEKSLSAEAGR